MATQDQPARRHSRTAVVARRRAEARRLRTSPEVPTRRFRRSASRSGPRDIAARRSTARSTKGTSWRSRRRSAQYRKARSGIDGPLFLGIDTHALSHAGVRQRARSAGRQRRRRDARAARDEYTPTPAISHAILAPQPRPHVGTRRRHRRDAVAQSARRRRLQVQPAERRPGGDGRHPLDRGPRPTRLLETRLDGVQRIPYEQALRAATTHRHDYLDAYVADLGSVVDMEVIRGSRDPHRRRSARRRRRALLGADRRALRARPDRRQRPGRPDVSLHDGRLGRPDPHGSVVVLCDAATASPSRIASTSRSPATPITTATASSRRRPALLPPNHYLAVAIDYLFQHRPQWGANAAVGKTVVSSALIDLRHRAARPHALRSSGRLQVVRRRPARRLARFRRRRKRRRDLPASRRYRLDHRQGRHRPGTAGGRDHRAPRARPGHVVCRARERVRQPGRRPRRRARDSAAKEAAGGAHAAARHGVRARRRTDHRPCSPTRRATARRSAASR